MCSNMVWMKKSGLSVYRGLTMNGLPVYVFSAVAGTTDFPEGPANENQACYSALKAVTATGSNTEIAAKITNT